MAVAHPPIRQSNQIQQHSDQVHYDCWQLRPAVRLMFRATVTHCSTDSDQLLAVSRGTSITSDGPKSRLRSARLGSAVPLTRRRSPSHWHKLAVTVTDPLGHGTAEPRYHDTVTAAESRYRGVTVPLRSRYRRPTPRARHARACAGAYQCARLRSCWGVCVCACACACDRRGGARARAFLRGRARACLCECRDVCVCVCVCVCVYVCVCVCV